MKNKDPCPECGKRELKILKIDKEKEDKIDLCEAFLSGRIKETKLVHYIIYECKECGFIFRKEIDTYK